MRVVLGVGVVLVVPKDTDANDYREDGAIMQLAMRVTKTMTATTMRVLVPQLQLQALLANFQLLHKDDEQHCYCHVVLSICMPTS